MRLSDALCVSLIGFTALATAFPNAIPVLEDRAVTTTTTTKKNSSSSTAKTTSSSTKKTTTSSTSTKKTSTSTKATSTSSTKATSTSSSEATTSTSSSKATTSSSTKASTSSTTSSSTTSASDGECTNSATSRECWNDGYSIAADFDEKWPTTGTTRNYEWVITNGTIAPDGTERLIFLINGQFPGPTLYADWGDYITVTITNKLQDNGTGIHWHGIRQYETNLEDGVPGITECPLAPGQSKTYSFHATQYGTSWYHSHWSSQYGDGVLGAIVINGPATANYDEDLGPLLVTDWYYTTAAALAWNAAHIGGLPPTADNGLINGTMVAQSGSTGGSYYTTNIVQGKKYRIRIINTSVDNHFMVSLDSHPFLVITSDFVPITPYTAEWIFVAIGQRYDVIIDTNQTVANYWFRAEVQAGCGTNNNNGNILSIFSYDGTAGDPTSEATTYTSRCTDETQLVPYWDSFVPTGPLQGTELNVSSNTQVVIDGETVVQWNVNFSALSVDWSDPIIQYVLNDNTSYPASENLISLPTAGEWYYWIIQEVAGTGFAFNVPHPIHLHGHDFYVLGAAVGTYTDADFDTLNFDNPPRRDVAMLVSGGYLVLAFQTDNPGAWIMHCHIAWHAGEGLAVQFLESVSEMESVDPATSSDFESVCSSWKDYYPSQAYYLRDIDDSGI